MKKVGLYLIVLLIVTSFIYSYEKIPKSGVGLKISSFGIPNALLDLFIYEHPKISGTSFSFEVRTFALKGPASIFSGIFALEYSKMNGTGYWRIEQHNRQLDGSGEVTQLSLTATVLLNIFPSLPVHPYIGAGIGIGKTSIWSEGTYRDELGTEITDSYKKDIIIPVGHVPVGIKVSLFNKVEVRIEGGFKNGFYFGGGAVYYF